MGAALAVGVSAAAECLTRHHQALLAPATVRLRVQRMSGEVLAEISVVASSTVAQAKQTLLDVVPALCDEVPPDKRIFFDVTWQRWLIGSRVLENAEPVSDLQLGAGGHCDCVTVSLILSDCVSHDMRTRLLKTRNLKKYLEGKMSCSGAAGQQPITTGYAAHRMVGFDNTAARFDNPAVPVAVC